MADRWPCSIGESPLSKWFAVWFESSDSGLTVMMPWKHVPPLFVAPGQLVVV